ncbi:MAG: Holliday junction resolvase RuvX [Nitrospinae bacterium]|nr:Holliday junction resolvase RuvX [Nitrospinota bacterium]
MKKIMALDYGSKRIGVAASDPLGLTAQGVCVIERKNKKKDIAEIVALADKLDAGEILMGKPMRMTGTPGTLQEEIELFAVALEKAAGRPVTLRDERFTTVQAERHLIAADVSREKRKGVIDKIAAQLLLQNYLDSLPRTGD